MKWPRKNGRRHVHKPRAPSRPSEHDLILSSLRLNEPPPDMTDKILRRVDRVRPFLPRRHQRMVRTGRACAALVAFAVVASIVLIHASLPDAYRASSQSSPLSDFLRSAQRDLGTGMDAAQSAWVTVSENLARANAFLRGAPLHTMPETDADTYDTIRLTGPATTPNNDRAAGVHNPQYLEHFVPWITGHAGTHQNEQPK